MFHMQLEKDKIFYPETKDLFVLAWNIHLQNEAEAEKLRLQFSSKPGFNPYQAFQIVDNKSDGFIDKEEVNQSKLISVQIKDLLIRFNMYVSEKEICALIDRYDRKRDGRITYSEFMEELNPKTGQFRA